MDQNLRRHFERALGDEPAPPPGDMAREAMTQGARLRRRRGVLAGGAAAAVVVVVATMTALNVAAPGGGTVPPSAIAAPSVDPSCTSPTRPDAVEVSIVLRADVTDEQRLDLYTALRADPLVRTVSFQSAEERAYQRFAELWRDSPDNVQPAPDEPVADMFRVELAERSTYPAFVAELTSMRGVRHVVGSACPAGAPSGEGG